MTFIPNKFHVGPIGADRVCPVCGQHERECNPSNCPAWSTVAKYDHEQGRWLPVDLDGYVPDGRHESEVR